MESVVRRSRFITTLAPAPDDESARRFIEGIRAEFPDATHNCWAFVAGPPGSTARVGMSDDGEPHGTAGRPMLSVLLHAPVGEVAAVVTRYYGGVQLGRGGLGRAYAGGVQDALASLPTRERVERTSWRLRIEYGVVDPARRLLEALEVEISGEAWGEAVTLELEIPRGGEGAVEQGLADLSGGAAELRPRPPLDDGSGRSA